MCDFRRATVSLFGRFSKHEIASAITTVLAHCNYSKKAQGWSVALGIRRSAIIGLVQAIAISRKETLSTESFTKTL